MIIIVHYNIYCKKQEIQGKVYKLKTAVGKFILSYWSQWPNNAQKLGGPELHNW